MTPHNTVDAERLLPCPFCGGEPGFGGTAYGTSFVNCTECLAATGGALNDDRSDREMAAEAWNRRAARAEPQGKAERGEVPSHLLACTCPSGDGSLRWPCPKHPPTGEDTAAAQDAEAAATRLWQIMGDPIIEFDAEEQAAIQAGIDALRALAQRPAAPREGVRGSGEAVGHVTARGGIRWTSRAIPRTGTPLYTRSEDARDGGEA